VTGQTRFHVWIVTTSQWLSLNKVNYEYFGKRGSQPA